MGYNIQIVRKNDYDDFDEESHINLDEWLRYISTDNELTMTDRGYEMANRDPRGFVIWTSFKKENVWFDFQYGTIYCKNPSEPSIRKMMNIADKLDGKVQGDDGEIYDEEYLAEITKPRINKRWWEFWK